MEITFDDEIEYWKLALPYKEKILNVTVSDRYEKDDVERVAQKALVRIGNSWEKIEQNIINALLDVYNNDYNKGEAIDSDTFLSHLNIELVSVEEDGELEIYFDDDSLFDDKWVSLEMESDDSLPTQAELIG